MTKENAIGFAIYVVVFLVLALIFNVAPMEGFPFFDAGPGIGQVFVYLFWVGLAYYLYTFVRIFTGKKK